MKKKFNCILLIDDDIATNEYHEIILKEADVTETIHAVTSGQKALDYLSLKGSYNSEENVYPKPDLIFLDINMPAMNGFEFMEAYEMLNQNQKGKYVFVMLTSSLNPDDKKRADQIQSINDYKNKPLTLETVKELYDKYLPKV